ncbi:hypothetical protein K7432_017883, partial [Basidiobolus ranarum]
RFKRKHVMLITVGSWMLMSLVWFTRTMTLSVLALKLKMGFQAVFHDNGITTNHWLL